MHGLSGNGNRPRLGSAMIFGRQSQEVVDKFVLVSPKHAGNKEFSIHNTPYIKMKDGNPRSGNPNF
jgi:hypothetical protein